MANSNERIGVHHCAEIAERNEWMFRDQPVNDIGIDAHIEFTEKTGEAKQLLALQIKSGESWFAEQKGNCVIFRGINERQYNYWTSNSLPCIVVLYNTKDNMCIWEKLNIKTIEKTRGGRGKGFFVKVPLNQVFLNDVSNEKLLSFTNLPEHIKNYNFLLSQKEFMQIIHNGGTVKLHSKEWINKSSGKGDTELIFEYEDTIKKYSYPYFFPFTPYSDVFPKLFPWACFSADENFYYESDEQLWRDLNCYYDKEDDEWLIVGESFDDFKRELDPMRSIIHSGEVAEYMLVMSLNELGKSFLTVDDFTSQNRPYTKARPRE